MTTVKRCKLQWYGHVSRSSGLAKTILQGTVKQRRTKEEVGKQHQGMDRPGVRQVPEGSGEQGKMEKTGCKIICGAPTTHVVKGLMIIMMMMMMMNYVTKHQRTPLCLYRAVLWWKGDLLFVWHTYVGSPILPLAFTSCRRLPSSAPRRMVKRRLS